MTKLSAIPDHTLSITCGLCKHHTLLEVANLIAVVGGDTTAHEVRHRARCHSCGVKCNNTYQIAYTVHYGGRVDYWGLNQQPRADECCTRFFLTYWQLVSLVEKQA